jgi:pimeloyl-ACP methyl ester carboxylesterase
MSDDGLYARAGVRYITTDRAGYGRSGRHRGRSVADEAADVLAVADSLGLERFAVVGGSGGGPHALACAALLIGRVERVACQSSVAPLGIAGMSQAEWVAGMAPEHAAELAWTEAGELVLTQEVEAAQHRMEVSVTTDPENLLGEDMSEGDREFLSRPDVVRTFARVIAEQAVHGVGGWVGDMLAFVRPWGFDLGAIEVPVLLTHGAQDASAPLAHGLWLAARIPTARVIINPDGGHLPTDPGVEITATMQWLRGQATPGTT